MGNFENCLHSFQFNKTMNKNNDNKKEIFHVVYFPLPSVSSLTKNYCRNKMREFLSKCS